MPAKLLTPLALPLVILGLLGPSRAQSSDDTALDQPLSQAKDFLDALSGNVEKAYESLLKNSPIGRDQERVKRVGLLGRALQARPARNPRPPRAARFDHRHHPKAHQRLNRQCHQRRAANGVARCFREAVRHTWSCAVSRPEIARKVDDLRARGTRRFDRNA